MSRVVHLFAAAALVCAAAGSAASAAGASAFALVNQTGANITSLSIRRTGASEWRPLTVAPAAGARGMVPFADPDCAFDIRASLAGGISATWSGVNLCEVSAVTLRRDSSGATWVDYD